VQESDLIGRKLGPYEITALLNADDFVELLHGQAEDGTPVDILIAGRHLDLDPAFTAHFRQDARVIAGLRHPNIARILDFGAAENGHYIIFEHVEGIPLSQVIEELRAGERYAAPDDVAFLVRQIAAALDYIHRAGVVHGAVTPFNIHITRSDQAILTNFGVSLLYSRALDSDLNHSIIGGTAYMAPEQAADPFAVSPASDIYSLGAITYEIITGERPFEPGSDVDEALRALNHTAPDPRILTPEIPDQVAEAVLRALSSAPRERFRSAMRFASAIESAYRVPSRPLPRALREQPEQRKPPAPTPRPPAGELGSPRRPTEERVAGQRRPASPRVERREQRRLRDEARKVTAAQARALKEQEQAQRDLAREIKMKQDRLTRAERRRARRGLRVLLLLLVLIVVAGAGAILLNAAGILDVPYLDTLPLPPALAGLVRPTEVAGPLVITATPAPPTSTPTPQPTVPPTITPTPLRPIEATPVPVVVVPPLDVGSSAFRVPDGAVLVFVPAGQFQMGTDDPGRNAAARPRHTVDLSAYWLDETEVTNAAYNLCVEAGGCQPPTNRRFYDLARFADHPVNYVRHADAAAYCAWLAAETGLSIALPTEAQWEKAAGWDPLGGVQRPYPWGDAAPSRDLLNYLGTGLGETASVGSYPAGASAYGALDMAGNVWEWLADWFGFDYYNTLTGVTSDPTGPETGTFRAVRGAAYASEGFLALASSRNSVQPDQASDEIGFRCALAGERPPVDSGILTLPTDVIDALAELINDAASSPDTSPALAAALASSLSNARTALETGNADAALLALTTARDALDSATPGDLPAGVRYRVDRGLRWLQGQAAPPAENEG